MPEGNLGELPARNTPSASCLLLLLLVLVLRGIVKGGPIKVVGALLLRRILPNVSSVRGVAEEGEEEDEEEDVPKGAVLCITLEPASCFSQAISLALAEVDRSLLADAEPDGVGVSNKER